MNEMKIVVALLLQNVNLELLIDNVDPSSSFPQFDYSRVGLGIYF